MPSCANVIVWLRARAQRARYPSLGTMVGALERFASSRRGLVVVMGLVVASTAGLAIAGVLPLERSHPVLCNFDDTPFRGLWDASRRSALERAFRATGRSNAVEGFELVSARLDGFESAWLATRRASCEATQLHGEQPERVMALRATCLDRALMGTRALIDALTEVDAAGLDRSAGALPPSLGACSDVSGLLGAPSLPSDPLIQVKIEGVEVGLAVSRARVSAARGPGLPRAVLVPHRDCLASGN